MTRRLVLLTAAALAAASTAGCGAGGKTGAAPSPTALAPSASASASVSASAKAKAVPALPADLGYVDYAAYAAHRSAFDNRKVVLFYWTSWCPSSAAYQAAFQTAVRAHTLPRTLSIVQVDYDHNDVQPVGYDVTQYDLFVLVDRNGKALREPLANPVYGQVLALAA